MKPLYGYLFDKLIQKIHKTKYVVIVISLMNFICFYIFSNYKINWIVFLVLRLLNIIQRVFINITCEYLLVLSTK